eukprot:gene24094-biopygen16392
MAEKRVDPADGDAYKGRLCCALLLADNVMQVPSASQGFTSIIALPQAPQKCKISGNVAPQAPPGLATGRQRTHLQGPWPGADPQQKCDRNMTPLESIRDTPFWLEGQEHVYRV